MPSKSLPINPKSVLFLHEGYTEEEFFDKIFKLKIPPRSIRIRKRNLLGNWNINSKVANAIDTHLHKFPDENEIHVIIAIDREGNRNTGLSINLDLIKSKLKNNKRIKSYNLIVATIDIESWFFIDISNIYRFLKITPMNRDIVKYEQFEKFDNYALSALFKKHGQIYQKRQKVDRFIDYLDLNKIYNTSIDLKNGIEIIKKLCARIS
jgi:hypothetical protein